MSDARDGIAELAGVLGGAAESPPPGGEWFRAAWCVARAAGITLAPVPERADPGDRADPVERIARRSHVRVRPVVLPERFWRGDCGPLLARTREGRPRALLPRAAGGYWSLDPLSGGRRRVDAAAAAELDPRAWTFYRPLPDEAARGWALLRFAMRGRGRDLVSILGCGAAATLLGMVTPQATAILVDHAIPQSETGLLVELGLGLLAAALGAATFRVAQGLATLRLETGADAVTQPAVWDRLLNLRLSFFRGYSTGDLQSRVSAIGQIRARLGGTTLRSLFGSVILLLNLGLLLYYSPALTWIALAAAVLGGAAAVVSGRVLVRRTRALLELQGAFFGLMVQLVQGVAKLRVAAAEERAFGRWAGAYARISRLELERRRIRDGVALWNTGLSGAGAVVLFAVAAQLLRGDAGLTTGTFLAFHVAFGTFVGAVVSLGNNVAELMHIAVLQERARPILESLPEVSARKADPGRLRGGLELDHVQFRYAVDGPLVLDDVSVVARPGDFVALVGPSGSGKSTLMRLILGFETPLAGSMRYDGQELAGLDPHAVRRQLGVVLQGGRINAGSLFDNICIGSPVPLEQAWQAARDCGFSADIEALPMGMHTVVSEGGTNLSGGQRQRLLLTRALVHRPAILLLDEATSALDNHTQSIVSRSLEGLSTTRLVIAHRLSTIRRADRIYVLDAGRIVQQGTFDELARQPGLFRRMARRQSG